MATTTQEPIIKNSDEPATVTNETQPQIPPPPEASTTTAATDSKDVLTVPRPPEAELISIPSYSKWFSWDNIHQCELRFLPEFFDGRSPSKNPKVYKYYRNSIIQRYRENSSRKITFTEVRKTIIGDVGAIRRVFDFLEAWGLINYTPSASKLSQHKLEDKEAKSTTAPPAQGAEGAASATASADSATPKKRFCGACKSPCTIACFSCDKHDLTLCARCYVRGNYRVGLNSSDFRRVEINEEVKTDWNDKETLHLLEAVMHYGDDWKKVAAHVGGGRSEKECVARFIKLPFGEHFVGPPESSEVDKNLGSKNLSLPDKRMRLTPLADASNPIMAQAAFLSALVGVDVAEVASHAAVKALSDQSEGRIKEHLKSLSSRTYDQEESGIAANGNIGDAADAALVEAQSQLDKEDDDLERALSGIAVQIKKIQDKVVHFEDVDLQLEKKCQQLQQLKNFLFVDQLTLMFHRAAAQRTGESKVDNTKAE